MTTYRADVIVIGGGIAGAAAAFFVSPEATTVLLETERQLAYHTTGRSAALFVENYGGPINERLAVASRSFLETKARGHTDFELLERIGFLDVVGINSARRPHEEVERARNLIPTLEVLDEDQILEIAPALKPGCFSGGIWNPGASSLDVMELHQAFMRGARAHGTDVHLSAGVRSLERTGGVWVASTETDIYEAPIVINAAGAWADRIALLGGAEPIDIRPMRRTAFTVGTDRDTNGWPFVSHDEVPKFYFKPESGGQLLCSPADETLSEPTDAKPVDVDIAMAIDTINDLTDLGVRSVRSSWAGLRSFAPDRQPVVGWDRQADGFFWLAGLGGTGINTSPAIGLATMSMVTGSAWPSSLDEVGLSAVDLAPR